MKVYVKCPACNGTGRVTVEDHVVSWSSGGYIREREIECPECNGTGEVEVEDA